MNTKSQIGIVDCGMGNIQSVKNAVNAIGYEATLESDPQKLQSYDLLILPGVGAFKSAMDRLNETKIDKAIVDFSQKGKPIVGICLGMQLLFSRSFEFGEHAGLGLIKGEVLPIEAKPNFKIPHMGWNDVKSCNDDFIENESDYYFVHSFYCKPFYSKDVLFTSNYGFDYCAAVSSENKIFGLQFHPEKSQKAGLKLLTKILAICLSKD